MHAKHYAEVIKFGLILTHLSLFWGKTGGGEQENICGGNAPMPPVAPSLTTYDTLRATVGKCIAQGLPLDFLLLL